MNPVGDGPGFGQYGATGIGELGFTGCLAVEQRHTELHFQVGDRVADNRSGAVQFSGGRRETADFHDRQEHSQLVQCRCSRVRDHACFLDPDVARKIARLISPYRLSGCAFLINRT
ncbi:hypothetical protein D3C85_1146760 [compost metagenome]